MNIKIIYSSLIASILAIIFATVVTIWGELSPDLKGFLKNFSGHHWVSKSILVMLIYFMGLAVFYFLPKNMGSEIIRKGLIVLIITTIVGTLAIFLFFISHYFGFL